MTRGFGIRGAWPPRRRSAGLSRRMAARIGNERGAVAGWEVLPFGFLVFVVGTLVAANAWEVVDAKMAVTAAAREGARAFVEASDAAGAPVAAEQAADAVLRGQGRAPAHSLRVDGAFRRCHTVAVTVRVGVSAVSLPWVGGFGGQIVTSATHAEVVDPLRAGVEGEAGTGGPGLCDVS